MREGLGQGCWADVVRGSKGTKPVAIDLHGCSVNVSKALLVYLLTTPEGLLDLSSHERGSGRGVGGSGGRAAAGTGAVMVITGKGNHVLSDGRRGVLREEVREFITKEMMMDVNVVDGNDGCLIVYTRGRDGRA